jgi:hypothetical protein
MAPFFEAKKRYPVKNNEFENGKYRCEKIIEKLKTPCSSAR